MLYWDMEDGIQELTRLYLNRTLVPFFGAGFSFGSCTYDQRVPDGELAKQLMTKYILENNNRFSKDYLSKCNFDEISSFFFNIVPKETRKSFFRSYFTEAKLPCLAHDFVSLQWPYAYTINVDDAIENTKCFVPVLPYKKLERPMTTVRLLYKLHGDAMAEINYGNDENIIFSQEQYLKSIIRDENKDILNNFRADYIQKNILFIGCSLKQEKDLEYVASLRDKTVNNVYRIVLKKGDGELEPEEEFYLEEKLGINHILWVNDYDQFYAELIRKIKCAESESIDNEYKYQNPNIQPEVGKEAALSYLAGEKLFLNEENLFVKSTVQILRSCIDEIELAFNDYDCVILKGRRFSGKTSILSSLVERQKKYTIYFFPSSTLIDENVVLELIQNKEHGMFIFDSNSISPSVYKVLSNSANILKKNCHKLLMTINSNDNHIIDTMKAKLVEVSIMFGAKELPCFNQQVDEYGFVNRLNKHSNIDYIKYLSDKQRIPLTIFKEIKDNQKNISIYDHVIILLLCARDKVFMDEIIALQIPSTSIQQLLNRFPVLIEETKTTRHEAMMHSTRKLVHNSKLMLLEMVSSFSHDEIISAILYIVKHSKNDRSRDKIYREVILFDTLNQIFGGKSGAGILISKVYESLEDELNNNVHYWLQRAKSIYRLVPNDKAKLEEAYKYAKKAYCDGTKPVQVKAALSIALICTLLSNLDDECKEKNIEEVIHMAYEAVFSQHYRYNTNYVDSELKSKKKFNVMLEHLCDEYIKSHSDSLANKADKIIQELHRLQSEQKTNTIHK